MGKLYLPWLTLLRPEDLHFSSQVSCLLAFDVDIHVGVTQRLLQLRDLRRLQGAVCGGGVARWWMKAR